MGIDDQGVWSTTFRVPKIRPGKPGRLLKVRR
jgi:hypothetical protein